MANNIWLSIWLFILYKSILGVRLCGGKWSSAILLQEKDKVEYKDMDRWGRDKVEGSQKEINVHHSTISAYIFKIKGKIVLTYAPPYATPKPFASRC